MLFEEYDYEGKINYLKDLYGLEWMYGSDLPPVNGILWYDREGNQILHSALDPQAIYDGLVKAIKGAAIEPSPYYPPLKRGLVLASTLEEPAHQADWDYQSIIPDVLEHPASFGHVRTHHRHEGVDLYAGKGDPVHAMVDGVVVNIIQNFTGEGAGSPWWNDTQAVVIEDADGVWIYGEIEVRPAVHIGQVIEKGYRLGAVKPVLKKDKGYPTSMLHLERYAQGTTESVGVWQIDQPQPTNLLDPTPFLIQGLII